MCSDLDLADDVLQLFGARAQLVDLAVGQLVQDLAAHALVVDQRAIDSANLAHMLVGTRTISFDMVVRTMYETGISMNRAFRETSEGGLARLYSRRAGTAPTRK